MLRNFHKLQLLNALDQDFEDYKTFSNEYCCNILSEKIKI